MKFEAMGSPGKVREPDVQARLEKCKESVMNRMARKPHEGQLLCQMEPRKKNGLIRPPLKLELQGLRLCNILELHEPLGGTG